MRRVTALSLVVVRFHCTANSWDRASLENVMTHSLHVVAPGCMLTSALVPVLKWFCLCGIAANA